MRASSLVVATAHTNGIITLEGIDQTAVNIVGASIGNLPVESYQSNAQSFSIKQGEKGMVALEVSYRSGMGKNSQSNSYAFRDQAYSKTYPASINQSAKHISSESVCTKIELNLSDIFTVFFYKLIF